MVNPYLDGMGLILILLSVRGSIKSESDIRQAAERVYVPRSELTLRRPRNPALDMIGWLKVEASSGRW